MGSSSHSGGNSHPCHEQTQLYNCNKKKKIPFEARLSSGSEVKRAAGGDVNVSRAASGKKPLRVTLRESR